MVSIVFDTYVYSVLLKIYGDGRSVPGIHCYLVGMRHQGPHMLRTLKIKSPDATSEQMLKVLMDWLLYEIWKVV